MGGMQGTALVGLAAACLAAAFGGCERRDAPPRADVPEASEPVTSGAGSGFPSGELRAIRIDGGYVYLTNMWLGADGELAWTGFEPGRRTASSARMNLGPERIEEIWRRANSLGIDDLQGSYVGGRQGGYRLVFEFSGRRKIIEIKYGEVEDRPEPLRRFARLLWQLREEAR